MTATEVIRRLHQHRMWVTRQLLSAVDGLSTRQLRQSFAIGQGTIWKTLTHLMAAEYVWLEALQGNESPLMPGDAPGLLPGNQEGAGSIESLDDLRQRWLALDQGWEAYLQVLSDESLDEIVYKISTSSDPGKRRGARRADVLLHLCTHAQYTTAQLVNMLRHLGCTDLPDVMLITMARGEVDAPNGAQI